jgi:hypothetical protein
MKPTRHVRKKSRVRPSARVVATTSAHVFVAVLDPTAGLRRYTLHRIERRPNDEGSRIVGRELPLFVCRQVARRPVEPSDV